MDSFPNPRASAAPSSAAPCPAPRRILHIDMDAYFASVEQLDRPELRGLPVAVGGEADERGVVAAASYEARAFGVRSAMPTARARRLCPGLLCVPPRFERYAAISRQIVGILRGITPLVETVSLDEAYLDVTHRSERGADIAAAIKQDIRAQVGLTASAGVGPSKIVAKIASDLNKPDGLVVVPPSRVRSFLAPLPVGRLWGVGPVTEKKLLALGIRTIGELAMAPEERLSARLGSAGPALRAMALGQDDRPVVPERPTRSISCERTLTHDTRDLDRLDRMIEEFSRELAASLRGDGALARTVTLKLRYADFSRVSRSRTLPSPMRDAGTIAALSRAMLAHTQAGRRPVRLLGLGLSGIVPRGEPCQLGLFTP